MDTATVKGFCDLMNLFWNLWAAAHFVPHHFPAHHHHFVPIHTPARGAVTGGVAMAPTPTWQIVLLVVLVVIMFSVIIWATFWPDNPEVKDGEFRCRDCKKIYPIEQTNSQMRAEAVKNLGHVPENPDMVCDECYQKFLAKT